MRNGHVGLSENRIPRNLMVNQHFPCLNPQKQRVYNPFSNTPKLDVVDSIPTSIQGSEVAHLSGTVPRLCRVPGFHSVPRFQSCRLPGFWGSKVPRFKGSRFQASRFQTCKGLGLIHQQRNDQRHAKKTQNTIELLRFVKKNMMTHRKASTLQLHKVPR